MSVPGAGAPLPQHPGWVQAPLARPRSGGVVLKRDVSDGSGMEAAHCHAILCALAAFPDAK